MYNDYLITGATGNLGQELIRRLVAEGKNVRALVLPGDGAADTLPAAVRLYRGDVGERASMADFFSGDLSRACLIHCAGLISIATRRPKQLWRINVEGTRNVLALARERGVARVVYVSSVHALPEKRPGEAISESPSFSPAAVKGHYAKSKAIATAEALAAARAGLNLSVVHPSGILSPADEGKGNISATILSYCRGKLPFAVKGGYDFVDVRDVVAGILSCAEQGRPGECYILSGHYARLRDILEPVRESIRGKRIRYLPLWLVKLCAPFYEGICLMRRRALFLTPYSAYTLGSNADFSRAKAAAELGYQPRALSATLRDLLAGFAAQGTKKRRAGRP